VSLAMAHTQVGHGIGSSVTMHAIRP
jgi:hypothetical protein